MVVEYTEQVVQEDSEELRGFLRIVRLLPVCGSIFLLIGQANDCVKLAEQYVKVMETV
jgi:hypothetical protein